MATAAASSTDDESLTARLGDAARDVGGEAYSWGRATVGGPDLDTATREIKTGQMTGQFAMMIQVAVILAVGVLIVGSIFDALPSTGTLNGAQTQVQELTGQAFELAPIVLIVVVASLIVGVVRRI
jgi:hypothetical protein